MEDLALACWYKKYVQEKAATEAWDPCTTFPWTIFGPEHRQVADTFHNMGIVHKNKSDFLASGPHSDETAAAAVEKVLDLLTAGLAHFT